MGIGYKIKCKLILYLSAAYKKFMLFLTDVCKLFLIRSKSIYALLYSKRRLIDLQKMLFWGLTNALLKSN